MTNDASHTLVDTRSLIQDLRERYSDIDPEVLAQICKEVLESLLYRPFREDLEARVHVPKIGTLYLDKMPPKLNEIEARYRFRISCKASTETNLIKRLGGNSNETCIDHQRSRN